MVFRLLLILFCLLFNGFTRAATPPAPPTAAPSVASDPAAEDEEEEDEEDDEEAPPVVPVKVSSQKIFLYWDGRLDIPPPALKIHGLIVSYAVLKHAKNGAFVTDYSASGNFQKAGNRHHLLWSRWAKKYSIIGAHAYLSYGGELNELFRSFLLKADEKTLQKMANEMRANMKRYHFSGLDINVQYWWDFNKAENEKVALNLATLVKMIRKDLNQDPQFKDAPITLAVGWNAAGWVSGMDDYHSAYSGTMLSFFKDAEAMNAISAVNVLTFGTNTSNFYSDIQKVENMLNTFAAAGVPKLKIMLVIQPYQTADAEALEPYDVVLLARFIKQHGFGGLSLFGITPGNAIEVRADEYIEAMRNGLEVIDILPPPPKPK